MYSYQLAHLWDQKELPGASRLQIDDSLDTWLTDAPDPGTQQQQTGFPLNTQWPCGLMVMEKGMLLSHGCVGLESHAFRQHHRGTMLMCAVLAMLGYWRH